MTEIEKHGIFKEKIILMTFGGTKVAGLGRTRITRIADGDNEYFQEERIVENKAGHLNIETEELESRFLFNMESDFRNAVIYTESADFYIRKTKKGNLSVMRRKATKAGIRPRSHNSEKKYIIPDGDPVPFLIELGIMDSDGKVKNKHFSKFRQINRFLELVDDEYDTFSERNVINVFDLCCGKGYLTLAMQHYFSKIKNREVSITGIDLKRDVIKKLNEITRRLKLEHVRFEYGDINDAEIGKPDMVIALHACDTATDIALSKAVRSGTHLIMSVPCCQHELFNQLSNRELEPMLKYGIMKDKFTELSTNALRGLALEAEGYNVKMIEFTSLEHTMKNIMIKAVKGDKKDNEALEEFRRFSEQLNVKPSAAMILSE